MPYLFLFIPLSILLTLFTLFLSRGIHNTILIILFWLIIFNYLLLHHIN